MTHPENGDVMNTTGAERITAERRRQVEVEGWTPEHDATHAPDILTLAAVCYAMPERMRGRDILSAWPWAPAYWKPTPDDRVRELVKAGALIAAAIDLELALAEPVQITTAEPGSVLSRKQVEAAEQAVGDVMEDMGLAPSAKHVDERAVVVETVVDAVLDALGIVVSVRLPDGTEVTP